MSYSHTPHFQQVGIQNKLRAHTESDVDYPYSQKEFSLQKRISRTIDRDEEEQNNLKDSIQKRLSSLKKQLGMDNEMTEDEKYISKMDRFSKRLDRTLDQKDELTGVVRHRNEFDRQLAAQNDSKNDIVNTSMTKKLDERSFERRSFAGFEEKKRHLIKS